ncbi:hypothetical protein QBC39DRAFT_415086 [Podospora conica]|nr:hypothetical protein QBC39DRAFT_415086 [Schizothecium conicum]
MAPSLESGPSRPSSTAAPPPQKLQMTSRSRAQSTSSDRPSTIAYSFMSPPLTVSPEAAFIAASAASQIVTNDHDSHADAWYDQHGLEPSGDAAAVSPAALQLVNNFLDQLLFNFLAIARSTSLSTLRPAVSEVLKPKLAKDAINLADEELREYLGGDDEDLDEQSPADPVSPRDWDLELAWKRTRLRCMVYSSLGDMEEEDEDFYMEQGHLDAAGARPSEVVSPAVAIFLTSIMEFMGETALIVAGQAAYHRMRTKHEKDLRDGLRSPSEPVERITVEELDMERVALDRTLGRLWRAWKKKIRSPGLNMDQRMARSFSRESAAGQIRSPSSFTGEHTLAEDVTEALPEDQLEVADEVAELEGCVAPASIPLPMGERDVDEIEVPGLAYYSDDETEAEEEDFVPTRPKSWMAFAARVQDPNATPTQTQPQPETHLFVPRKRSNSVPTRAAPPLRSLFVEVEASASEADDETTVDELVDETPELSPRSAENEDEEAAIIGQALTTQGDYVEEPEYLSDDEVVIEEPQIMISSRVSIAGSGRSSSPSASERGKPAAIITNLPLRTPSIRSARLIDVAPRSPAVASRRSSADATESVRQVSTSRMSGGTTPPIIEERMRRSPDSMSAFRAPAFKSGLSETHSISEAEEVNGADDSAPNSAVYSATSLRPEIATVYEEQPQLLAPSRTGFGSVAQRAPTSAPADPPAPQPVTKVTILSSTPTTYYDDVPEQKPEPPRKPAAQTRPQPVTPTNTSFGVTQPPVPERSAVRQSPSQAHPSTIGQVYVERSRNRSPSEPAAPRPHESPASVRQQHTSGSNSSASTSRLKPVRTSEETTRSRKDVARNFEELIHSDETIQYTLTPESMRDIDAQSNRSNLTGSPVMTVKTRKSDDVRNGDRSRSSSFVQQAPDLRRSTSATPSTTMPDVQRVQSVPSKPRAANPPQARDARLPRESVAELAEFLRSTGPNGASVLRDAPVIAPSAAAAAEPGRASTSSNATTNMIRNARLQARGASTDHSPDNSDLIDFIRRGPAPTGPNPRIPRTVAPFRTTMDSDQLSGGGRAVDAQLRNSQASTTNGSVPSSINSQSALLPAGGAGGRNKPLPPGRYGSGGGGDDDMPMPVRKTRRVRDPYAIDLSDEDELDDDLEEPTPRQQQRRRPPPPREESLLDFLNSVPPPPEPVIRPFITNNMPEATTKPKKKASAPSLMARFTRRDSTRGSGGGGGGDSSGGSSPSPRSPMGMFGGGGGGVQPKAQQGQGQGQAPRGYIPIQVNMQGGQQYGAAAPSQSSSGGGSGGQQQRPKVPMKKFEPREAVSVSSRATSDLAEFFRNAEPPPSTTNVGAGGAGGAGGGGGAAGGRATSGMFGRRKEIVYPRWG